MSEIDLIPGSYRRRRWLEHRLRLAGVAAGLIFAALGGTRFALARAVRIETREIEQLRAAQTERAERTARREALQQEQTRLAGLATVLGELRGGLPVDQILLAVDRALEPGVWFDAWNFTRAGEFVAPSEGARQVGYFVVLPREPDAPEPERGYRLLTHMEIHGQARDHAALAGFVKRLVAQPEVGEARVLRTEAHAETGTVDFELAVLVSGHG